MTIEDWPVSYDELEPHYDRFDKLCGVSGKAGNLRGKIVAGGNPFEGPRSDDYPNKPIKTAVGPGMFSEAAKSLGYHPFPLPVATSSAPYVNPEGMTLGACEYCGHCNRTACEANAKASPNVNVDAGAAGRAEVRAAHARLRDAPRLRQGGEARDRRRLHRHAHRRGIRAAGRHRRAVVLRVRQHAACCWPASASPTIRDTGKGVVGKNYGYQFEAGGEAFFEDSEFNPFMGAPGMSRRDRRLQRRELRPRRAWASSAAATSPAATAARRRSAAARCRTARRAGARNGSRRPRSGTTHYARSTPRARSTPTATTSWTSIRPTRTRSAGR